MLTAKFTLWEDTMTKQVCSVCGYVYDSETPFELLGEDYVCPVCGVGKELFEAEE